MAFEITTSLKETLPEQTDPASPQSVNHNQVDTILAEIMHNRGCIATEVNMPNEALKFQVTFNAQMIRELGNVRGGNDMRLAISWNELGNAHMLNKDWRKGQKCFRQSIDLMRKLDDFEETWISLPICNLGLAQWLQGNYAEALEILLKGLKDREDRYGAGDRVSFV